MAKPPKPPKDKKRVALIAGSLVAHGAIAVSMFVSGVWHIDQLDPGRRTINLAVLEPPAPAGSPATPAVQKLNPKQPKKIIDQIVQPVKIDHDVKPVVGETVTNVVGNGLGSGSGSGDNPDGPTDSPGHCVGAACAPAVVTKIPDPPRGCIANCTPKIIAPPMLSALRYAGDTAPTPSDTVKQQMMRDDHKRSSATFRVCLDTSGTIDKVTQLGSTGYPDYDGTLRRAIDTWRYHPYQVDGQGIAACGMVTFVYTIR